MGTHGETERASGALGPASRLSVSLGSAYLDLRSLLGSGDLLYGAFQRLSPGARSRDFVDRQTDVSIDGPSGSGNSFFVHGFRLANPDCRIAHHHHVAAQMLRAVRFGVPALALLRRPVDCVASRAIRAKASPGALFRQWLRFFRATETVIDRVTLVSFETATERPSLAVEALNRLWGASFDPSIPDQETIFDRMDRDYGGRNPNRPSTDREFARRAMRAQVSAHRLAAPCESLYERLAGLAV